MRSSLIFASDTTKTFAANPRRGDTYHATIQNLTNQSITITVTNQRIQGASPTFDEPAVGALVITAGSIGALSEPYQGWLLTGAAPATGTVEITEAG
jgi:hypothetical protein